MRNILSTGPSHADHIARTRNFSRNATVASSHARGSDSAITDGHGDKTQSEVGQEMDQSKELTPFFTPEGQKKALSVTEAVNYAFFRTQMNREKASMKRASRNEDKKTVSTEPAVAPELVAGLRGYGSPMEIGGAPGRKDARKPQTKEKQSLWWLKRT